ncbi:hypothetical protein BCR44DRAFT_83630 [Catenaria anguillulae PL171]|uniref:Uncharacterized protein n=1 Tax=Catenaria anguillulae PL171 TaxID=765915 RepID=A0A1Y2HP95_9FUNG|nr:hypothetical protein BCR44DRAFT_83630 [Catenaria anguillulae PL171]
MLNNAIRGLHNNLRKLSKEYLPVIAGSDNSVTKNQARFRLFSHHPHPNITDFIPLEPTSIEVTTVVMQAASVALTQSVFGQLTAEQFKQSTELKFLTDNLRKVLLGLKALPDTVIAGYDHTASFYISAIYVFIGVSLVFPFFLFVLMHNRILNRYFTSERRILRLIRDIPKRKAGELVSTVDEEIESFREITDGGDSPDDASININPRLTQPTQSTVNAKRGRRYTWASIAGLIAMASIMLFMFMETLNLLNIAADMQRMIDSGDRRFYCSLERIYSREYIMRSVTPSHDHAISKIDIIQQTRAALTSLEDLHEHLDHDEDGLIRLVPALVTLPRDCTNLASCPGVVEDLDIGMTRETGSLPLNTEIVRLLDTGRLFIDSMVHDTGSNSTVDPLVNQKWRLLMAITTDVMSRLGEIDSAIQQALNDRLAHVSTVVIVTYVCFLLCAALNLGGFVFVAMRRLKREAKTLATLLFLIPPAVVKEMPELFEFLESGGLTLNTLRTSAIDSELMD